MKRNSLRRDGGRVEAATRYPYDDRVSEPAIEHQQRWEKAEDAEDDPG
jgi:hypothetical protein